MTDDLQLVQPGSLAAAGQVANRIAGAAGFSDYRSRKAANTLKRQAFDLVLFAEYLQLLNLPAGNLLDDPEAWRGMSWGLVAGFARWMLAEGYAIGTVNVRLSTVRVYASLAGQAGTLAPGELSLIQSVHGYRRVDGKHVDEARLAAGQLTRRVVRRGRLTKDNRPSKAIKKAEPVGLTREQAAALKTQPDHPQGRRDALLMCLLLDHGLRAGEVARLTVDNFDLKSVELRFYRPKVDKVQIHRLTADTLRSARAYLAQDAPGLGSIWRGSRRGADLTGPGMGERAITRRVLDLGLVIGVQGLSAHDCRHYWATQAARMGTPLDRLKDAGGWASLAMPARYIEAARVANEGVLLP